MRFHWLEQGLNIRKVILLATDNLKELLLAETYYTTIDISWLNIILKYTPSIGLK